MIRNYRHHGKIEQLGTTLTSRGQRVDTWTEVCKTYYGRQDAAAGEVLRGRQVAAESTHRLTMHWIDGVTTKMRLVDGDRTFEFVAVRDVFDNQRTLEIDAREIT